MFYHGQQIPIKINNKVLVANNAQLSSEISLMATYSVGNYITTDELTTKMWKGELRLQYYLTGQDYLKQYIYTDETFPISGNIAGLQFNQGYLSNYSLSTEPNSPVLINASIAFFDQLTGTFVPTAPQNVTGFILRNSDVQLINLNNYTVNPLNNITKCSFVYAGNIQPLYHFYDTGTIPSKADYISIEDRTIELEITSDNTNLTMPLTGEKFGLNLYFSNPNNTGLNETVGCSGLINSKQMSSSFDQPHSHTIKISQHHLNKLGYIQSVTTGVNSITINFNTGSFPLFSRDGTLNYLEYVDVGDTQLTGYSVNRTQNFDQITAPIPFNINNDILTVSTSYGNYVYPNLIVFPYSNINVTGLSINSGVPSNIITISGTNFARISNVSFGGNIYSPQFQVTDPQTIQAIVPNGGASGPITVASLTRNISGKSNNFYYSPLITNMMPVTGQWNDFIILSGTNFSGTSGVFFNNIPAQSFSLINNQTLSVQTPNTGKGFPSGYINIQGTGGGTQSISVYNPVVPIYNFSPLTGLLGSQLNINTKIDTGYMFPFSGGYKARIGGNDIPLFISGGNSTGCLTGIIQTNSLISDYIYIYSPNGISVYPSQAQLSIIQPPNISYITPSPVNLYEDFNLLVAGNNLNFFQGGLPYALALSGAASGNFQTYNTGNNFFYSSNGQTLLVNNIIVTGETGYYNVIIQNAGGSVNFTSGLLVNPSINLQQYCTASYDGRATQLAQTIIAAVHVASYAIDGPPITGTGFFGVTGVANTFASIFMDTKTGTSIIISPVSSKTINPYINLSILSINSNYDISLSNSKIPYPASSFVNSIPPTGRIRIMQGANVAYDTVSVSPSNNGLIPLSGYLNTFQPQITGVTSIVIYGTTGNKSVVTQIFDVTMY